MVAHTEPTTDARLLPRGGFRRPPLLALSRRTVRARDRSPALVCARAVCMSAPSPAYAELAVATNFSFLRGASRAEELVMAATLYGHYAIGIADLNSLAGVVRVYDALEQLK